MKVFWVSAGMPEGNISEEDQRAFQDANQIFVGVVQNVLADHIFDTILHIKDAKTLWDYLAATFGASDAGKELYIMETFHDYKIVANKSIVEQAHEIHRSEERRVGKECRSRWSQYH